jgi:hypothetical protein
LQTRGSGFYSSSASIKKRESAIRAPTGIAMTGNEHYEIHHTSQGAVNPVAPSDETAEESSAAGVGPKTISELVGSSLAPSSHKGTQVLGKIKKIVSNFRSLVFKTRAETTQKSWGKRLHEVVIESNGSEEYKSSVILEFLEAELTSLWLYCAHLSIILELFAPLGLVSRSNMGSYRVELVIMLFDRILDLHNFEFVLMVLSAEEHASLLSRIGVLNLFNPCKSEGGYSFDLKRWEERQICKILIHLSVVEPGENCKFAA